MARSKARERGTGNGDVCPIDPEHGHMVVLPGQEERQFCPHQSHDGRPKTHPEGEAPPTRAFWPTGIDSFRRASIQHTLPEIDISILGG